MALKINNTNVTALKLGASNVVKAYLGNNLLFQSVLTPSEMILSTSGGIIQKVDKNTWNVIQSSSLRDMASDSSLLVITGVSDENFIYLASANRERIYKIARNDLSLVGTTPLFGVTLVTSIVQDEEHIYVFASATHSTLGAGKKYSKNTLNLVSTGPSTTNRVSNATLDNGILYLGRTSIRGIWSFDTNWNVIAQGETFWRGDPVSMVTDNNFIYLNRKAHSQGFSFPSGPNRVQKVNKITLLTEETVDVGAAGSHNTDPRTNGFINQNDYLLGGQSFRNINKYDKDTLSGTTLLNITGSDIARYINSDGEKIFVGATAKLWIFNSSNYNLIEEAFIVDSGVIIHIVT